MIVRCSHCGSDFEVADPAKPSSAKKAEQTVVCFECRRENRILWPADLTPLSRKCEDD